MGRQDDLDRMRRFEYDQSPPEQAKVDPILLDPQQPVRRSRPPKFALWMMTLVGMALTVILLHNTPSIGPIRNPLFLLTSTSTVDSSVPEVGDRILDFTVTQSWNGTHMGIDVALPNGQDSTGEPLYAIGYADADVEVICWYEPITGLNVSTHSAGMDVAFDYSHLNPNSCATEPGERVVVKAGQKIAEIGNSGAATTGPHLHFQQRQDGTANPITGTHEPGWRTYIELSLSGNTLSPSGRVEESAPVEPVQPLTPLPPSPQQPGIEETSPLTPEDQVPPAQYPENSASPDAVLEPARPPSSPPRILLSPNSI